MVDLAFPCLDEDPAYVQYKQVTKVEWIPSTNETDSKTLCQCFSNLSLNRRQANRLVPI